MKLYNILLLALALSLFSCKGSESLERYGEVVDISEYGAVYDEVLANEINLIALRKAINSGNRIKISGTLFTSVDKIDVKAKHIFLFSENEGKIVFTDSGYLFSPSRDLEAIIIQGLIFKTNYKGAGNVILINKSSQNNQVKHLGHMIISDNTFYGNIKSRIYGTLKQPVFFFDLKFENNTHHSPGGDIWYIIDAGRRHVDIRNNSVYNLAGTYFNFGGNNNAEFRLREYITGKEIIEDNEVLNEDDFWVPKEKGYVAFVLLESNHSEYRGNHFEGVKSLYAPAIYDVYQSSNYSIYIDNKNINNFAFKITNQSYGTRALYKAKGGREKHIKDNVFILEEAMLEKGIRAYNKSNEETINLGDCWTGMISSSASTYPQDIYYENNLIDVPILRNDAIGKMSSNKLIIKNNTFHVNAFYSKLFGIDHDNYQNQRVYEVSNNTFYKEPYSSLDEADIVMPYLIRGRGAPGSNKDNIEVIVKNNTFHNMFFNNLLFKISADQLTVQDNIFESTYPDFPELDINIKYGSVVDREIIENNTIKSSGEIKLGVMNRYSKHLTLGRLQGSFKGSSVSFNHNGGIGLPEEHYAYKTELKIVVHYAGRNSQDYEYEIVYSPNTKTGNLFEIKDIRQHKNSKPASLNTSLVGSNLFRLKPTSDLRETQPGIYLKKINDVWQVFLDTENQSAIHEIEFDIETKKI